MTPEDDEKLEQPEDEGAADETAEAAASGDDAPAAEAEDAPAGDEPAAEEPAAEAKPKRRTRRKKADADAAPADADAGADAEADAGADADEAEEKPKSTPRRRRGSAETSAGTRKRAPRRAGAEDIEVRARAKYVRTAPRKARLVVDHIRGKPVEEARAILRHTTRSAAQDVLKVLNSAVANAEHNHELDADELVVRQAYVDEGPTLKRFRPRAQGRATRIRKRTSHLTVVVATKQ